MPKPKKSKPEPEPVPDITEKSPESEPTMWRAALAVMSKYGPMTVVGLGLVYFIAINNSVKLDKLIEGHAQQERLVNSMLEQQNALMQYLRDESERAWQSLQVQQRTCLNTSTTEADKLACVTVTRRPQ